MHKYLICREFWDAFESPEWAALMRPRAGDPAPDFRGVTTDGTGIGLADVRGTKLVLYFYPMDSLPDARRKPARCATTTRASAPMARRSSAYRRRMRQAMMGLADRVSFIIDEQGTIAHVIGSPGVTNHAEEVLARL